MDGQEEAGKPKPLFFVAVVLVIAGLVGFAAYRMDLLAPKGTNSNQAPVLTADELKQLQTKPEAADVNTPTTVKEYTYVASEKLPPVKGVAAYQPLGDSNTVRFALNVWAGWAPVVFANEGFKPKKVWTADDGKSFQVELVLIDDPVAMRNAFAAGQIHIGWATVDMLPLFMEELKKDSRTMPRVFQQIDWSNGGDGIVARDTVKNIGQLRGKTVVLAQNSPSQYFILNALINSGVQPSEVNFRYTADAFQAAAAFSQDKNIAAAVSWAPDIYNLSKIPGNRMLVTTGEANRLIADVWFARADFAQENRPLIASLVQGFLDAVDALESQENKKKAADWMAEGYNLPQADALGMLGDAHWTNYAENREFFLNANNPTNFEQTWSNASFLYKRMDKISEKLPFASVVDFSVIKELGKQEKYASSVNKYTREFAARSVATIKAESGEILTKTVVVHFFPNNWDLRHKIIKNVADKQIEEAYDPNVDNVLKEIATLAGQFGASRIVIEGHTDASMRGSVPFEAVRVLSQNRADAVRAALLEKYSSIPANQIATDGLGWKSPADPNDPDNHAKNRRVEVKVYPLEAQ